MFDISPILPQLTSRLMPVLEDDVLLFEAVEDEEMAEAVGATGKGKGGRMQLL